ncbi:hypothetical protein B0H13DRAFT_2277951, partial [Mycena leptocephala]
MSCCHSPPPPPPPVPLVVLVLLGFNNRYLYLLCASISSSIKVLLNVALHPASRQLKTNSRCTSRDLKPFVSQSGFLMNALIVLGSIFLHRSPNCLKFHSFRRSQDGHWPPPSVGLEAGMSELNDEEQEEEGNGNVGLHDGLQSCPGHWISTDYLELLGYLDSRSHPMGTHPLTPMARHQLLRTYRAGASACMHGRWEELQPLLSAVATLLSTQPPP